MDYPMTVGFEIMEASLVDLKVAVSGPSALQDGPFRL